MYLFYALVKVGAVTKRWWVLCTAGESMKPRSFGFKEVDQKRLELGMVSCESNQNGKNKDFPKEAVNALCG